MSTGFYLKKVIGTLVMPLPVITILLLAGLLLLWFTRRHLAGKILITAALVLLYVLSLPFIPYAALTSIEQPQAETHAPPDTTALAGVQWIVVLSGGGPGDPGYSSVNRVGGPTLARLVEGIRVWRQIPDARLIVSGGDFEGDAPSAPVMRDVAVDLGVDAGRIVVDDGSLDTAQSAQFAAELVGGDRLVLVTSASHMPRSLLLFQEQGIDPIPVRAAFSYTRPVDATWFTFSPVPGNLTASTTAWYEFLGRLWTRVSS